MQRIVCVGENSQGKSYFLRDHYNKNKQNSVYIRSEEKADNELRNTADSSELMKFVNNFIEFNDVEKDLNRQLQDLMVDFAPHERIEVDVKADFSSLKNIVMVESNSKRNDLGEPGSGDRFLAQLTVLKYMLSKSKQKEKSFDTLIIDEPERHFHPSIHYELGRTLKDISKQGIKVVVASHSPDFVKGFIVDLNDIYYFKNLKHTQLDKIEDYVKKLTNDEYYGTLTGQMKQAEQKLFANHDYALKYINIFVLEEMIQSLFAPKIFLGEGYAERMMYRLYKDKYPGDYFFFQTNGKFMMPWIIDTLKAIDDSKKIVVMYDKDDETEPKHRKCNELINAHENIVKVVSDKDIEQRLCLKSKNKVRDHSIELLDLYIEAEETSPVMQYIKEMHCC